MQSSASPVAGPLAALCGSLFAWLPGQALAEAHEARDWVMRMDRAVEQTNYEGRMVYMRRDHIGTFQIFHSFDGGNVRQRLIRMDGEGAEIIRRENEVMCIFPKQRSVVVEKRVRKNREQNPLGALPAYTSAMTASYDLVLGGTARVAGREAVRVSIAPKDAYRYGYRLWLDKETAMPLKAQLIDGVRQLPLEELLFTNITLGKEIAPADLESKLETSKFTWVQAADSGVVGRAGAAEIRWRATDLPKGFMLTDAHLEYTSNGNNPRMHLVYSDSIASVSVFIDEGVAASEQVEGLAVMGAANAYSVMQEGWLVTAMGEVPPETVQRIAVSVGSDE